MYLIDNIIERVFSEDKEKLSILIGQQSKPWYVKMMCATGHNFYAIPELYMDIQKSIEKDQMPANLKFVESMSHTPVRSIDAIVSLGRGDSWERCRRISSAYHIPMITVDFASSEAGVYMPIGASVDDKSKINNRGGFLSVAMTPRINASWQDSTKIITSVIPPYAKKSEVSGNKILVDEHLPKQFIEMMPVKITEDRFTISTQDAGIYIHLWTGINNLMMDCMASRIPVVIPNDPLFIKEYKDFIDLQSVVVVEEDIFRSMKDPDIVKKIKSFGPINQILDNAERIADKLQSKDKFIEDWNKVLRYCANSTYIRGI